MIQLNLPRAQVRGARVAVRQRVRHPPPADLRAGAPARLPPLLPPQILRQPPASGEEKSCR